MRKAQSVFACLILLLSFPAHGQKQQYKSEPAGSCEESPLFKELLTPSGSVLLSLYGYSLYKPWDCTRIDLPLAPGAGLLHFKMISTRTDDFASFSVIRVPRVAQIWVIPTESGMLEVPNVESDPHNLAAFNALLRSLPKPPTGPVEWSAVGKQYMVLVGHTGAVAIEPLPGEPSPCSSDGECTLAFADRTPNVKESYTKWTLTFSVANGSNPPRLTDATREIVSPAESQAGPIDQRNGATLSHESGHADPQKQQ
jgi:hypothetical protein